MEKLKQYLQDDPLAKLQDFVKKSKPQASKKKQPTKERIVHLKRSGGIRTYPYASEKTRKQHVKKKSNLRFFLIPCDLTYCQKFHRVLST